VATPREVADVLRPRGASQRPALLDEPLHPAQVFRPCVVAGGYGQLPAR